MRHAHHVPISIGVALAAGLWGLYWWPQRYLEGEGLTGVWGTLAQYIIPLVLMTPFMAFRAFARGKESGVRWLLTGTLMGGGIVCYANSFLLTEVVRALLLFYLTPLWATLLERFALDRTIPRHRYLTLALALAGVWVVLGQDGGVPVPDNAGDWLALLGGAMITGGAARVNATQPESAPPLLFSFYVYGSIIALATSFILRSELRPVPDSDTLISMLPILAALVVILLMPTNTLLIWSPAKIGAGVFGILILTEIVFGAGSAALRAGERFGWRETAGCAHILLAGTVEVIASNRQQGATA